MQDKVKNKIVCVVNDYELFNKVVKNNENSSGFEIIDFDNTTENISITKRYNDFINENILNPSNAPLEDYWVLFTHQDFGFLENIDSKLSKLDKSCIYGPIGVTLYKGLFIGKEGFKKSVSITWGQILQGNNDFTFKKYGRKLLFQKIVDSVDCCCIMIHSSLIKKHNLLFDENLSFHMYAEELCYRAKKDYKISIKVVKTNCFHTGKGNLNEEFFKSVNYLKSKFNIERIPSTCKN